jgi:hypothetical protein
MKRFSIYELINPGDLEALKEQIATKIKASRYRKIDKVEKEVIDERDAAGANIIHLAYLLEDYRIGRWLVETFPQIALLPYSHKVSEDLLERKPKLKSIPNYNSLMPYAGISILLL